MKKNLFLPQPDGNTVIGYTTNTNKPFLIDVEDLRNVSSLSWYESNNGYVHHKDTGKPVIQLHRFIMMPPENMVIDHINHNRMDNRRCNLRICTQRENSNNRLREPIGLTKIYRGANTYYVVQLFGKYRGCFKNIDDALKLRDEIYSSYKEKV